MKHQTAAEDADMLPIDFARLIEQELADEPHLSDELKQLIIKRARTMCVTKKTL